MKKLVIRIRYGGLGDNLLWSPIPRLAKEKHGYDKVYISSLSEFRNPETKKLVWDRNPYIDGYIEEDAPAPNFGSVEEGKNILDALVDFVGLPDDGIRFREPELFYSPVYRSEYAEYTIYDPNYISEAGHPSVEHIQQYFESNDIRIDYQMELRPPCRALPDLPSLSVKGLYLFCDLIYSCKAFYCLTSGSATLASAICKPVTVLFSTANSMFHHSKNNTYVKLI